MPCTPTPPVSAGVHRAAALRAFALALAVLAAGGSSECTDPGPIPHHEQLRSALGAIDAKPTELDDRQRALDQHERDPVDTACPGQDAGAGPPRDTRRRINATAHTHTAEFAVCVAKALFALWFIAMMR